MNIYRSLKVTVTEPVEPIILDNICNEDIKNKPD